eukprot:jgi/Chlat1/1696/Chrsp127S01926
MLFAVGFWQEVSLHQQEIEQINRVLGQLCRHLEILYLQNNLISKIENVHRLKELQYLNLAISGLHRCESLSKLDLTVNFVSLPGLLSVERLRRENAGLRELFLTGNPCTDWEGYRQFVVGTITQLKRLDGQDILPSERISAQQALPEIRARLISELEAAGVDWPALISTERRGDVEDGEDDIEDEEEEPRYDEKGERVRAWSAKTRLAEHRELTAMREESEAKKKSEADDVLGGVKGKPRRTAFEPLIEGERVWQKNEGQWDFMLRDNEDDAAFVLDIPVGKYMDTSLMEVDVQPSVVRVLIKGRLLQLVLQEEVMPDKSYAQRSATTGALVITMPKMNPTMVLGGKPNNSSKKQQKEITSSKPHVGAIDISRTKLKSSSFKDAEAVDVRNIVQKKGDEFAGAQMREVKPIYSAPAIDMSDANLDDEDVPPLE